MLRVPVSHPRIVGPGWDITEYPRYPKKHLDHFNWVALETFGSTGFKKIWGGTARSRC